MKKFIFLLLMSLSMNVYADITSCVDDITGGKIFRVFIDWNSGLINVNGRRMMLSGENMIGTGITTTDYFDRLGQNRYYAIFQAENIYGASRTWIGQYYSYYGETRATGNVYPLICPRSFIRPFLKNKYA